ncbi:MAG: rhomboid family intramembrane serine protease [Candidatus Hydrothermarchaeales archaeon]
MFPIKDDNPTKKKAWVTYSIILINIAVFAYEIALTSQGALQGFIYSYAIIPMHVVAGIHLHTLFTSMFLHGGFMHIFGNMLYLYIFGNNIEDIMGKRRFLIFYILCGLVASFLQILVNPASKIPNLGASGAIAGVLGAYLVIFPHARIHTILFFGYFVRWVRLPAILVLGFWFVIQLFSGLGSLAYATSDAGGVAFFAHVGGFLAGMLLVWVFKR